MRLRLCLSALVLKVESETDTNQDSVSGLKTKVSLTSTFKTFKTDATFIKVRRLEQIQGLYGNLKLIGLWVWTWNLKLTFILQSKHWTFKHWCYPTIHFTNFLMWTGTLKRCMSFKQNNKEVAIKKRRLKRFTKSAKLVFHLFYCSCPQLAEKTLRNSY